MHAAGDRADGLQLRGLILVLWRAGLRISKALAVNESDLDPWPRGKGRQTTRSGDGPMGVGQLAPWPQLRATLPVERSSACCAARPAAGPGRQPVSAPNFMLRQLGLVSGVDSPRTSSVTLTPWKCHAKGCRS